MAQLVQPFRLQNKLLLHLVAAGGLNNAQRSGGVGSMQRISIWCFPSAFDSHPRLLYLATFKSHPPQLAQSLAPSPPAQVDLLGSHRFPSQLGCIHGATAACAKLQQGSAGPPHELEVSNVDNPLLGVLNRGLRAGWLLRAGRHAQVGTAHSPPL